MEAISAVVENGRVILSKPIRKRKRCDAILVLLDSDPWRHILDDPRPRPKLIRARQQALAEFAAGRVKPIDPGRMK